MRYCFWFTLLVKNSIPVPSSHNNSYSWVQKQMWLSRQLARISFPRIHLGNRGKKRGYVCSSHCAYGIMDLGQDSLYHLTTKSFCSDRWTHSVFLLYRECVILVPLSRNRWKVYLYSFPWNVFTPENDHKPGNRRNDCVSLWLSSSNRHGVLIKKY